MASKLEGLTGVGWCHNQNFRVLFGRVLSIDDLYATTCSSRSILFCHFASQVTKRSSAKALDSLRHVVIGNEPLVSKAAAAAERSIHCPEAAGKVLFSPSLR